FVRVLRIEDDAVGILVELVGFVLEFQLLERSASVAALQQRALLDADIHDGAVARVEGHMLHMRNMRRRREVPLFAAWRRLEAAQFLPAVAVIPAAIQVRRLGSGVNLRRTPALDISEREDMRMPETIKCGRPTPSVVGAAVKPA